MTEEQRLKFRDELLEKEKQIERNLNGTFIEMNDIQNMDPRDDADYASMSMESNIDNAIVMQQKRELNEIKLALGKISTGAFGICEMCEDEINIERLRVKNFARFCISCREEKEKEKENN